MSLSLTLFLISLFGIVTMIGRKLSFVRNGEAVRAIHSHPFAEELYKIKNLTFKSSKKIGYVLLFISIRFFIKSSNFIKNKSINYFEELKNKFTKNKNNFNNNVIAEKKEVSKYLKIISEYRHKIKQIKHRIKEEEGIE